MQDSGTQIIFDHELLEERDYWLAILSRRTGTSGIRPDHPRSNAYLREEASTELSIDGAVCQKLNKLTGNGPFLFYTALMAALKICLHRYTGDACIVVGSPARKQADDSSEQLNVLPIVNVIDDRASFKEFVLGVRESLLGAYARQHYPFSRLIKDLGLDGINNQCPLFDITLSLTEIHRETPDVKNDVTIEFTRHEGSLSGLVRFNARLFERDTIRRFIRHFTVVLTSALDHTTEPISRLEMLDEAEKRLLLQGWNNTAADYEEKFVFKSVVRHARSTPDALAISVEDQHLSFAALNRKANHLARCLKQKGLRPDSIVGLFVDRGVDMAAGMLGILKAGGAYVPMDPAYPNQRLGYMLNDCGAEVVVTQERLKARLAQHAADALCLDDLIGGVLLDLDDDVAVNLEPENLAYVIYTSGSTGNPKGVAVTHSSLANLVNWHQRIFNVTESDRATQVASFGFDASVWETWPYLSRGASLHVAGEHERLNPARMLDWMAEEKVTISFLPTPMAEAVLRERWPEGLALETLLTGGDRLHRIANQLYGITLINNYGPTESAVVATSGKVEINDASSQEPSIGRPIQNIRVNILDGRLEPVPVAVEGEVCISGAGLARGYIGRADLTAERFMPNAHGGSGERAYRTGDMARYAATGEIEFLGRKDTQVKIRGYRIELSEIEQALSVLPGIEQAVVDVKEDHAANKKLVAYIVADGGSEPDPGEIRGQLRLRLPEYMVPTAYVQMHKLPLNDNGKVDRRALPDPEPSQPEQDEMDSTAQGPTEEIISGIWRGILGVESTSARDNFFELGGHSLLATQLMGRVRDVFEIAVPLRVLFEAPTLAEFSRSVERLIKGEREAAHPPLRRVPREDGSLDPSFAQQRLWFAEQAESESSTYNVPALMRLKGDLDFEALARSLREIVRRHDALRTVLCTEDGLLKQRICSDTPVEFPLIDLRDRPEATREEAAFESARHEALKRFDLAKGPLFRAAAWRLGDRDHIVGFTMHHIISDARSLNVFVTEMAALYAAYCSGLPSPLPELSIQYADFATWQRELMSGEVRERQLEYWREQLRELPVAELPLDRPRPAVRSFRGATQRLRLSAGLTQDLKRLSQKADATEFMTLLAGFKALLYRYSGQEDVVVGATVTNRQHSETEKLIGFFVNMIVLRSDLSGNPTFLELLNRVRAVSLAAYAHQDLPFEELVKDLRPDRRLATSPLFQVVFGIHYSNDVEIPQLGVTVESLEIEWEETQYDLIVRVLKTAEGLMVSITYSVACFDDDTITRLLKRYEGLLTAVAASPELRLLEIPLSAQDSGEAWEAASGTLEPAFEADQFTF